MSAAAWMDSFAASMANSPNFSKAFDTAFDRRFAPKIFLNTPDRFPLISSPVSLASSPILSRSRVTSSAASSLSAAIPSAASPMDSSISDAASCALSETSSKDSRTSSAACSTESAMSSPISSISIPLNSLSIFWASFVSSRDSFVKSRFRSAIPWETPSVFNLLSIKTFPSAIYSPTCGSLKPFQNIFFLLTDFFAFRGVQVDQMLVFLVEFFLVLFQLFALCLLLPNR